MLLRKFVGWVVCTGVRVVVVADVRMFEGSMDNEGVGISAEELVGIDVGVNVGRSAVTWI